MSGFKPCLRDEIMTINVTPVSDVEKDLPLREDIRLLGRILGDTVREQEG